MQGSATHVRMAAAAAVALGLAAFGAAGAGASPLRLRIAGGGHARAEVCGHVVRATVVTEGRTAVARASAGRRRVALRAKRCRGSRTRIVRRSRTGRLRLPTRRPGEFRVVAQAGHRHRSAWLLVRPRIVTRRVRFAVRNVNRSALTCQSDGLRYTVAGRLVAPSTALRTPRAVTLYLHEFGWGRFFWQFAARRWNYARAQAAAGHASVVVDRLGYDESSKPPGRGTCLGSQADVAHQIVSKLRAGRYATGRGRAPRFRRVALAGHSGGGAIAELEAYSFGGIDALVLFAYADQGFTMRSIQEANEQGFACLKGGERAEGGGPGGYAYFAQTAGEWRSFMFTSARPRIARAAATLRNSDPCGDAASLTPAVITNHEHLGEITVPVLMLYGTSDAIYDQPGAGQQQRDAFSGSRDVRLRFFARTGHALTLERAAPAVRATVSGWLARRGF